MIEKLYVSVRKNNEKRKKKIDSILMKMLFTVFISTIDIQTLKISKNFLKTNFKTFYFEKHWKIFKKLFEKNFKNILYWKNIREISKQFLNKIQEKNYGENNKKFQKIEKIKYIVKY